MSLIEKNSIDTNKAIKIYNEAEKIAKNKAEQAHRKDYAADDIAPEIEKIITPILMSKNLLDPNEYSRIEQLVNDWYPENLNQQAMMNCALMQQVITSLLPIFKRDQQLHQQQQIKTTVSELKDHLKNKIDREGAYIFDNKGHPIASSPEISSKNKKLATRYNAIFELDRRIKDKNILDPDDLQEAKNTLNVCLSNKPGWSERPLLQKLTDVLSFGFKALYRAFTSKEKELEDKVDQSLKPR